MQKSYDLVQEQTVFITVMKIMNQERRFIVWNLTTLIFSFIP